jgi:hypothetical protein
MTIHYFDTGQNGAPDSLGLWLDRELAAGVLSFRGQFGFFDGSVFGAYLPALAAMVNGGGTFRLVIGANPGDPPTTVDLATILPLLVAPERTALTLVALSGALFHPKTMHLVRADGSKVVVVGSANFTRKGLGHSIEAGLILESASATQTAIEQIGAAIDRWATVTEQGVHQVRTAEDIEALREQRLVVTPAAKRALRSRQRTSSSPTGRGTRPVGWRPGEAPEVPEEEAEEIEEAVEPVRQAPEPEVVLVWQSKPLTRRDLTIPTARGTNQTGSVNLDKGQLAEEVDHRHYFRDEVFQHLDWNRRSATVDEAFGRFGFGIDGVDLGEFDLAIRHTTSTTTRAYLQRNAMTRLSWGPVRGYVARPELIGRTLSLYRQVGDPTRFAIKIEG